MTAETMARKFGAAVNAACVSAKLATHNNRSTLLKGSSVAAKAARSVKWTIRCPAFCRSAPMPSNISLCECQPTMAIVSGEPTSAIVEMP